MGNPSNASMPSGNGNANCFWEEPAVAPKAAVISSKGQANIQQNGTGKALAKSQTVSNMQSVANSPKTNANANASKSSATISKTSSSGNVTAIVNSTSNNNNKKAKGGNSNAKKGKAFNAIGENSTFNRFNLFFKITIQMVTTNLVLGVQKHYRRIMMLLMVSKQQLLFCPSEQCIQVDNL